MDLRGWDVRVVALGVVVAVLAGCTGDPDPVVTPTPSQTPTEIVVESPSPTPSPSPTVLTEEEVLAAVPADLSDESFLHAVLFSRFFIELYPAMLNPEHDSALFSALSSPECEFCGSALETVSAQVEANAYSEGGNFTWSDDMNLIRGGRQEDGYWHVEQPFEVTDTLTYSETGELLGESPGGLGIVTTRMTFDAQYWFVAGVNFEYEHE